MFSRYISFLLFFWLVLSTCGQNDAGASSEERATEEAVTRAVSWMLGQRQEDYSWGPFTPRAVVALTLSQDVVQVPKDEMSIITKQLNILLTLELSRNLSGESISLSRLALYVNALYATCQDPHNFHGLDLVRILRHRTNTALANTADFRLPAVFLPLCLAGDVKYEDMRRIISMHQNHKNNTDLQALEFLALTCIDRMNTISSTKHYLKSMLTDLIRLNHNFRSLNDVYTHALVLQALNAASDSPAEVKSLIEKQLPGWLLRQDRKCSKDITLSRSSSYRLSETSPPKVHYSVWVGEGDNRDAHSVTVPLLPNGTFFDVMNGAQARNRNFRFSYEETKNGKHVYSLAGIPNDVQRELYWGLYTTKREPNGVRPHRQMKKMTVGVDRIYPAPGDHFIFWFKRYSSE
ncbi:uncharacterized protein CDAR_125841 [Caerostris darwini]|uniref:Uncharacterized protein n=1 Tax=Caerostris darwini TaxID=1538125 RepID=A0AAV4U0T5_9ARAC|nr:uncharacterized protein CDAR_125841 [Caerostris darwini]